MPRYRLTIAYDGTAFHGWQKQHPPAEAHPELAAAAAEPVEDHLRSVEPDRVALRTVQEVVEQAVRRVCRERVILTGASRTDAGVHAAGQVAAFTSTPDPARGQGWPADRGTDRLVRAVNGSLPPDVTIRDATLAPDDFDPIAHAVEKEYTYTFAPGERRPLWDRAFAYWTWHDLDAARMNEAAAHIVGEHDFAAFAQINHGRRTTVRTVFRCSVEEVMHEPVPGIGASPRIVVRVSGSGFLYNTVRIIAGTLFEVGRGKIEPNMVPTILESRDRTRAGPTLPPEGLRLEWVRYGGPARRAGSPA